MINNDFYEQLHEEWYTRLDHPIALLRAENGVRVPWIIEQLSQKPQRVLDIGCGGGLLTNALSEKGHEVTGIDLSESSLEVARKFDLTKKTTYLAANGESLPFADGEFDVVCAMDLLEHVEDPSSIIQEASRVLKPGGRFFFHTFNRNWLSYIVVIKGVEWFVKNTPRNMHVYPLFIKPKELKVLCQNQGLEVTTLLGFQPKIASKAFLKLLVTRKVPPDFPFVFSKNTWTGYCGISHKKNTISSFN